MGWVEDLRCRGFKVGQSSVYFWVGIALFVVAVVGWFALLHTPLIWWWSGAWLLVLVIWAIVIMLGDTDSPRSQRVINGNQGFHPSVTDPTDSINDHHHD